MIHPQFPGGRAALLTAAASFAVITSPALAAIKTWDGGGADDNWQTGPNWNADTAPLPADQLVFAGTVRPTPSNDFAADTAFNGISVSASAAAFTLSGNAITLTRPIAAGGVAVSGGIIVNSSANPLTLALPINLASGKQSITSPTGSGGINFSGAFSRSANSSVIFTTTGGPINFNGSGLANDASGILGGWAVIGDDWATLNGSGNVVPYTGYTGITAGAITTGPNLNYRFTAETGDLTAATGTTINTLQAKINANRNLNITGQMRLSPNGGIYRLGTSTAGVFGVQGAGSTLTADGGGAINLWDATTSAGNFGATNNNLRIDSAITDDGVSPVSVNIMGYVQMGTATLGANTYSGGTFVNQGRVQAGNPSSFGTGPVTIYPGGQAFINSSASAFGNSFTVSGNGTTETNSSVNDGPGAIRLGTGSTVSGTVTYSGATRLTTNSGGAGGTFSGRITGSGALQVGGFGSSPAIMNLSNVGTPNDWDGPFTISSLSTSRVFTLRLGASGQIPDTSSVTVTGVGAATSTFELNGFNETIGGLNSAASALPVVSNMASSTTSTLTFGANNANGDFGGTLQDKSTEPTSTLNVVKTGSGKQILRGLSTYFGTTTVDGGTLECIGGFFGLGDITVNPGGTLAANDVVSGNVVLAGGTLRPSLVNLGQLSLSGNLTIGTGSTLDLSTAALPNPPIIVTGTLTPTGGAGSVTVNLSGTEPTVGQHQLVTYSGVGPIGGVGAAAFVLGQKPPRMVATIIEDVPGQALVLDVTASGVSAQWTGALSTEWSTATLAAPKNWVLSNSPGTTTDFLNNDSVIFNDSATVNTVDISVADVTASAVTFDNTDDDYTLTGSKGIIGAGILTKTGTGKLTVTNPNGYTGGTVITAGTVEVGNGGSLGTAQIHNEGLLVINRSDASTFAPVIEGFGDLHLTGTGTTTLSGANLYDGDTVISAGTLRVTNSASLGVGPVQVQAGAAVDLAGNPANNQNFGAKQFSISGNGPTGTGALVHSGTVNQLNAYQLVALEGDASVGGTGRFDIRGGTPVLDLNSHTLRKRGTNQFTLVGATVEDGGTIIVEQGLFAIETTSTTNGSGSVIIEPGAYGGFYQNVPPVGGGVTWTYTLREGSAIGNAGTALATIPAPIVLEGNSQLVGFNASAPDPAAVRPLTLTGNITESGGSFGLTKNGISVVTLAGGANTYSGPTAVNGGSLVVDGSLTTSPVTVAAAATLGGTGVLGGTVAANGTVSPGMALVGTLSTGAVDFAGTGSLAVQIDSGILIADKLVVSGSLDLGGAALTVTDLGAATLAGGTKFVVASYTGGITGAFSNVADGGSLTVGGNTFDVDYDEMVLGQPSVTLTVAAGSAYDDWAALKGLNAGNNGKLDDPDHDGMENIVEFGIDGNPLGGSEGKFAALITDVDPGAGVENAFVLTVPIRTGATFSGPGDLVSPAIDGIIYSIQGSTGLVDFTSISVSEVAPALSSGMPAPSTGWTYRSFRLPGSPSAPNAKAFLRVGVAEAP